MLTGRMIYLILLKPFHFSLPARFKNHFNFAAFKRNWVELSHLKILKDGTKADL